MRKEAFIKAVGEGLLFRLDKFEVTLEPNEIAKLLATHWESEDVLRWSIYAFPPEPNFALEEINIGKCNIPFVV